MRIQMILAMTLAAAAQGASANSACTGWVQVASPRIGHGDNVLASIAADSATDMWIAGLYAPDSDPNLTRTLIQHYDGTAWSIIASPNVGSKANALYGVTARGGMAWAVGNYIDDNFRFQSLIEIWDGSQWTVVTHPHAGSQDLLFSVYALSVDDVWAVGFFQDEGGPYEALTEHFDGTRWSIVPSPSPGVTGNQLQAVLGLAHDNVWTAGQQFGMHGPDRALIEHWDGQKWSVVETPADGPYSVLLYGMAPTPGGLVTVGSAQNDIVQPRAVVEVARGGQFFLGNALSVGTGENDLFGVATLPGTAAAWAVGTTQDAATGNLLTLIERLGSSGWVQEPTPSPGLANGNSQLASVLAWSPADMWAVGSYDGVNAALPLILRRCP